MAIAALVLLVLTALLGGFLLATWIFRGGLKARPGDRSSRFAPALIFSHAGLAATGLTVWVVFLILQTTAIAWIALAVLIAAAALGATMFGMWIQTNRLSVRPHRRVRGTHARRPRHAAEDTFPPQAVIAHGLLAVTTAVLVLITALQAIW